MTPSKQSAEERVEHTPTPWFCETGDGCKKIGPKVGELRKKIEPICETYGLDEPGDRANAELICRAVNSHEALVSALRAALEHVEELQGAWRAGAIRDGLGVTRSHRNGSVVKQIRAAIRGVSPKEKAIK